ncbi:MAG: hypothetical protein K2L39_05180 [Muribaculaceae bacterium]|nr:hypothetical protein [Muribaculaceae bacterium]
MTKKIAIIFLLALIGIGVNAQLPVGGWTIHSPFGGVSTIAETKNMTYYLSMGSLFSVDKRTNEVRSLNISNDLNGGAIKGIYPHPEGKYLIVAYQDCNIDRINNDGSVINISDISDALITGKPAINHVGFGNGRFYVATTFGLVTIDDNRNETVETMFSPMSVNKVFGVGDHVVIAYNGKLMAAPASEHLVSIDKFNFVGGNETSWTFGDYSTVLGDKRVLFTHKSGNNNKAIIADFDFDADKLVYGTVRHNNADVILTHIVPVGTDKAFVANGTYMFTYNADTQASAPEVTKFPAILKGQTLSALDGLGHMWGGNADGICQYDITDRANPIQLGEKFGKTEFSAAGCNRIFAQPSGNLFFWNESVDGGALLGFTGSSNLKLASYDHENKFQDYTPTEANNNGTKLNGISTPMWVVADPHEEGVYYVATWNYGLLRFKNGIQTHQYTSANSPMTSQYSYRIAYVGFDAFDNLWIAQEYPYVRNQNIHALPYSELTKENLQPSSWRTFDGGSTIYRSTTGASLSTSKMMVFARGEWDTSLVFINLNNSANITDDKVLTVSSYVDQDNKSLSFYHIWALCEDKKGRLWVGTDKGVFEITDPSKINSDVAQVNHLKVPRNDGTGLADYLLDALTISCIAVDSSNRKWISTTTAGVYLVSENGDQIIEHYDTSNSILPTNTVFSVACDPNSSSVFFATAAGVVEYNSTAAPASENLDDVYAYPNPVRPDYSGWITVTGLMDNTLVKIADSAGNVFFQGRSEGGMITWDGCNANGDRVKTGVYYVFASHGSGSDSGSDSCVTKIMVIN